MEIWWEMKKGLKTLLHCIIVCAVLFIGMVVYINIPYRIGHTNYYLIWVDDYRCLSFKDPNSRIDLGAASGIGILTCDDAFYNEEYIITHDTLLHKYYVIKIARDQKEYQEYRGLAFNDLNSLRHCIDSLGIIAEKMEYTRSPCSPFIKRPLIRRDCYGVVEK